MTILQELIDMFEGYEDAIDAYLVTLVREPEIKKFLTEKALENLASGVRPDGSYIEKTPTGKQKSSRYERYTIYKKNKAGIPTDVVNFYDTGKYYESVKTVTSSDNIYIISDFKREAMLTAVWGEFLGISDEQRDEFINLILPKLIKFTQKHFNK